MNSADVHELFNQGLIVVIGPNGQEIYEMEEDE